MSLLVSQVPRSNLICCDLELSKSRSCSIGEIKTNQTTYNVSGGPVVI